MDSPEQDFSEIDENKLRLYAKISLGFALLSLVAFKIAYDNFSSQSLALFAVPIILWIATITFLKMSSPLRKIPKAKGSGFRTASTIIIGFQIGLIGIYAFFLIAMLFSWFIIFESNS